MIINKTNPLTLKKLDKITPGDIFRKGTTYVPHPYLRSGEIYVKWIAIKLVTSRWQIHYSFGQRFQDYIAETEAARAGVRTLKATEVASFGLVVRDFTLITKLVPCSEEVLELYKL